MHKVDALLPAFRRRKSEVKEVRFAGVSITASEAIIFTDSSFY